MDNSASKNNRKIYFAAAVAATVHQIECGSRSMASEKEMWRTQLYQHIKTKGDISNPDLWEEIMERSSEGDTSPKAIYDYSITDGVLKSTHVVAEVSRVSHGVGMELGFAIAQGMPVLCLYRDGGDFNETAEGGVAFAAADRLSRMVRGAPVTLVEYRSLDEAKAAIDSFFDEK